MRSARESCSSTWALAVASGITWGPDRIDSVEGVARILRDPYTAGHRAAWVRDRARFAGRGRADVLRGPRGRPTPASDAVIRGVRAGAAKPPALVTYDNAAAPPPPLLRQLHKRTPFAAAGGTMFPGIPPLAPLPLSSSLLRLGRHLSPRSAACRASILLNAARVAAVVPIRRRKMHTLGRRRCSVRRPFIGRLCFFVRPLAAAASTHKAIRRRRRPRLCGARPGRYIRPPWDRAVSPCI